LNSNIFFIDPTILYAIKLSCFEFERPLVQSTEEV